MFIVTIALGLHPPLPVITFTFRLSSTYFSANAIQRPALKQKRSHVSGLPQEAASGRAGSAEGDGSMECSQRASARPAPVPRRVRGRQEARTPPAQNSKPRGGRFRALFHTLDPGPQAAASTPQPQHRRPPHLSAGPTRQRAAPRANGSSGTGAAAARAGKARNRHAAPTARSARCRPPLAARAARAAPGPRPLLRAPVLAARGGATPLCALTMLLAAAALVTSLAGRLRLHGFRPPRSPQPSRQLPPPGARRCRHSVMGGAGPAGRVGRLLAAGPAALSARPAGSCWLSAGCSAVRHPSGPRGGFSVFCRLCLRLLNGGGECTQRYELNVRPPLSVRCFNSLEPLNLAAASGGENGWTGRTSNM